MNDEEIYFGSSANEVDMYPCEGEFINFDISLIKQDDPTPENINKFLKLNESLSFLNKEYSNIYIQCIPEPNINLLKGDNISKFKNEEICKHCFIKFKKNLNIPGKITAIRSGHRSVIIKGKNGIYFKCKGCGNDESGFVVEKKLHFPIEDSIRGCNFENTCARELYYAYKINEALKIVNMESGIIPVGLWKYSKNLKFLNSDLSKNDLPLNAVPELDKYCSIFEAKGDKRARVHLTLGLELILNQIVYILIEEKKLSQKSFDDLSLFYPEYRRIFFSTYNKNFPIRPYDENKNLMTIDEWCKNPIYCKEQYDELVLNEKFEKEIKNNEHLKILNEESNKILDKVADKLCKNLNEKQQTTLKKIIENIKKILEIEKTKTVFHEISKIFKEVGHETGKIYRIFVDNHFVWGTYYEQHNNQFQWYTNAHPNNFIVLPKGNENLLAPVDFDYNYSSDKYINIIETSPNFKKLDREYSESAVYQEISAYMGYYIDNYSNYFKERVKEEFPADSMEFKLKECVRFFFVDSLIESFRKSFDKIIVDNPIVDLKKNDLIHELVKLSLVVTDNLLS